MGNRRAASAKLLSPAWRRACIAHVHQTLSISERRASSARCQHRSTQRMIPAGAGGREKLTDDLLALVRENGRLSGILTRLMGREVKTAEFQELPVMAEATQVTSYCDDGRGND